MQYKAMGKYIIALFASLQIALLLVCLKTSMKP